MTALEDLTALVANLPGASLISTRQYEDVLAGALVPDSFNVWPGQPGYEKTYDVYFAAIGLVGFLQAQPVVRQSSSEGTSVAVDAPNWAGLLAYYRSMSRISGALGDGVLVPVRIPDGPHVVHTDMTGRGDDYGDVNTDLG
jgi:hypothetical protein